MQSSRHFLKDVNVTWWDSWSPAGWALWKIGITSHHLTWSSDHLSSPSFFTISPPDHLTISFHHLWPHHLTISYLTISPYHRCTISDLTWHKQPSTRHQAELQRLPLPPYQPLSSNIIIVTIILMIVTMILIIVNYFDHCNLWHSGIGRSENLTSVNNNRCDSINVDHWKGKKHIFCLNIWRKQFWSICMVFSCLIA